MQRAFSRRGLILLAIPLLLSGAAVIGLRWASPDSWAPPGATIENARLLLARGDSEGAERILRHLQGSEAGFLLGRLLAEQGRWREAREQLLESATNPQERAEAHRLLAKGAIEHRDFESASVHLAELEKAEPKNPLILKSLAYCLLKTGDPFGSLRASQRALDLTPGDRDLVLLMNEAAQAASASSTRRPLNLEAPNPFRHARRTR